MVDTQKGDLNDLDDNDLVMAAKAVFAEFDDDDSGSISTVELGNVFRNMGQNPTEEELNNLILEVDADGSGLIEFDEFLMLLEKLNKDYHSNQFLKKARKVFDMFDTDGGGTIGINEL